jgi:hypothetical protein
VNDETVGIVTLVDLKNYGNRLQNYAVHELFRQRDINATTIEMRGNPIRAKARGLYYATAKDLRDSRVLRGHYYRSWRFTATHMRTVSVDPRRTSVGKQFDYFAFGSDQIWNPNDGRLGGRVDGAQCLVEIPSERKMLVAPSFGLDELPPQWANRYSEWLATFARLASRETRGAEMITDLTGRPAETMIDPTLALAPAHWRGLARARDLPRRPYLVTLLLGTVSPERRQRITDFAARHRLDVVNLGDAADPIARRIGPQEFLAMIDNARIVMTDSFHCCAFAFSFGSPLAIFDREGAGSRMSSRIHSLVSAFDLGDRAVNPSSTALPDSLLDVDYEAGTSLLAVRRNEFIATFDSELARLRAGRDIVTKGSQHGR